MQSIGTFSASLFKGKFNSDALSNAVTDFFPSFVIVLLGARGIMRLSVMGYLDLDFLILDQINKGLVLQIAKVAL